MKKIILISGLISMFTSSYALELCKEKFDLGDKFKEGKLWIKNGGTETTNIYQKIEGKEICLLEVTANKISKITKRFMIDTPIKPPVTFDSLAFQYGNILYVKDGLAEEKTFSNAADYIFEYTKGYSYLRYSKVEYSNGTKMIGVMTMCQKLGSKCTTVVNIEPKITGVNAEIKKMEETHNLKLFKTEGWK